MATRNKAPSSGRRTRVLMTTSTLPRWEGDTEPRFVLDLARSLLPKVDVELLAPHTAGAAVQETLEGIAVRRYRYWIPRWQSASYQGGMMQRLRQNRWRTLQIPFFFMAQIWTIARRLRQENPVDVIHAHWLLPQGLAAVLARRLARRPEVRIVCTSHGGDLYGLRGRLMARIKRWIISQCDEITVVSHAMSQAIKALQPHSNPTIIPMGTDLEARFTPDPNNSLRDPNHLIVVGRLVEKKGIRFLLEALALCDSVGRPTLDVVGHGPLRAELESLSIHLGLENYVRFLGACPHDELPQHYRRAAIAVFPFIEADDGDQEGFGLVMVEAIGCGCTVLASDLPAVRDVLPTADIGLRVPPEDPEELVKAILDLIRNPATSRRLAKNARAYALSHFSWRIIGDRYRRLLSEPSDVGHDPDDALSH
ncbi:glycosyl transferase group 1 [Thioalkalivibrio denitrificans]|uniref:Glycosyl transferase group 1 n=1 Tax=Thioalkalivibrio denitrificans TaxID=108003 RepID=A0A1V3NES1_9GAMM|nr:glycosyltransferase family 4 protein [Thioalkalivibrio denitrificans]OOG23597.1 glycosyl transferase group 1 [Thioalkalivibrio denitrificans]